MSEIHAKPIKLHGNAELKHSVEHRKFMQIPRKCIEMQSLRAAEAIEIHAKPMHCHANPLKIHENS